MIERLCWLHISDLHFRSDGDLFSQNVATRELTADLRRRVSAGSHFDFVLVTGDLAYSGVAADYHLADEFLKELSEVVGVPGARFYFVPGNHDVDRSKQRLALQGAREELTSQAAVDRLLGEPLYTSQLLERQGAFWEFERGFTGDSPRIVTADGLAFVARLQFDHLRIAFLGLNSSWLAGRDAENGELLIGERQVINALEASGEMAPHLVIAAAHHPIEWLKDWDAMSCHGRLLPEVDVFHRGHLHSFQVAYGSIPERPCLMIAAGSSHATRHYENSYNIVHLELGEAAVHVQAMRYLPTEGTYEAAATHSAPLLLRAGIPGDPSELVAAIRRTVPSAESCASYLAAVILGRLGDVPARVDSETVFLSPDALVELASVDDRTRANSLLALRNLLSLYDNEVAVEARIVDHKAVLEDVARWIDELASGSATFRDELTARDRSAGFVLGLTGGEPRHRTLEFLRDLWRAGDFAALEAQARRHVDSDDVNLARFARERLAEALMRSDESAKVREAASLALELCLNSSSAADYLRAGAASEAANDDQTAIDCATRGLTTCETDDAIVTWARGLATRTGSTELRQVLDEVQAQREDAGR